MEIVGDKVLKVIFSVANSWYTRIATHVATIAGIGFAVASQPPTHHPNIAIVVTHLRQDRPCHPFLIISDNMANKVF